MIPETDFAGRQIVGARRAQEDYYCFCQLTTEAEGLDGLLLVLADGMGGHAGGALASRIVVEAFIEQFCLARGNVPDRLLDCLRASERRLRAEIARQDDHLTQMGATLVGAVWTKDQLYWVSVGDSGLYLFRNGGVQRINEDHSMAPVLAAKADRGEISAKEAAEDPRRNLLRSAIAAEPPELYDLRSLPLELLPGDIVVGATDGLASLNIAEISAALNRNAHQAADHIATGLLAAVSDAGNPEQDNATVAVIHNRVTSAQQ
jgi:PPM family protein phosphatase